MTYGNSKHYFEFFMASGVVGTLLFFRAKKRKETAEADSAEIGNTEQVVKIQSEHITRLDGRVKKWRR